MPNAEKHVDDVWIVLVLSMPRWHWNATQLRLLLTSGEQTINVISQA
jgi:hypothetical protein